MKGWTWFGPIAMWDRVLLVLAMVGWFELPYHFSPVLRGMLVGISMGFAVRMQFQRNVVGGMLGFAMFGATFASERPGSPNGLGVFSHVLAGAALLGFIVSLIIQWRQGRAPAPAMEVGS